jgi:hypothetical protein
MRRDEIANVAENQAFIKLLDQALPQEKMNLRDEREKKDNEARKLSGFIVQPWQGRGKREMI